MNHGRGSRQHQGRRSGAKASALLPGQEPPAMLHHGAAQLQRLLVAG